MKTPDDIKKGLKLIGCNDIIEFLKAAEEGLDYDCNEAVAKDALAYIQQLESRLAEVERERDAAVADLNSVVDGVDWGWDCQTCKHKEKRVCENCEWQWRGVCEENTKDGADV